MLHDMPLIETIVAGLGLAFLLGTLAHRLGASPIVGYLLAGVAAGPFTPGFVADQGLAGELSELGVILLMFGVGLHFSLGDLLSVRAIALPGAIAQIAAATLFGMALSWLLGWGLGAGLVFGLALSVASTVVLLRAMQERRLIETARGRIAVGWLIVEDLAMVLALVLLPAFAGPLGGDPSAVHGASSDLGFGVPGIILVTVFKLCIFVVLMLVVGRRIIPWLLQLTAASGSRELFRLAVLAIALGVAFGAASLFGVSLALGAFFAGMIMSESELSHRAAEDSLPLRDAFAVLFFVSVGMLFDPASLISDPLPVLATLLIIVVGKSLVAFALVRLFGHPTSTALTISVSLAQIGEFSFILATLGLNLKILPPEAKNLILGGAILSIVLNPFLFAWVDRWRQAEGRSALEGGGEEGKDTTFGETSEKQTHIPSGSVAIEDGALRRTELSDHLVLVGYGRVGSKIARRLADAGRAFLVIEDADKRVARVRAAGFETVVGNAVKPEVLDAAHISGARDLVLAFPNSFEAVAMIAAARAANPDIRITARVHSGEQRERLIDAGADTVVNGDEVTAQAIADHVLSFGPDALGAKGPIFADDHGQLSEASDGDELTGPAERLP
ncbi:sodium:proton antiporter [Aureimonas ureilytica]|uniref:Sodium:proton antiporter n=1 Tax=Aureimonas ureilytica TaxID=401562 RepID=A0A175RE36_9HYPH|nr:YbaL family putative K(+) efflux transporter [Aureimonas ureilytica]KTQ97706.1 sodium:proton antiporter [Aureimonas ureilytica]